MGMEIQGNLCHSFPAVSAEGHRESRRSVGARGRAIGLAWAARVLLSSALVAGCAPTHAGRTVGQGVLQAEGGLGGPFFTNFDAPIPVPNIPVGVRYGLTDRLDVQGHINLLPLVVGGFLAIDGGVTYALLHHSGRDGINLATSASLAVLTDFHTAARVVPVFDLAGGYTWHWLTGFMGAEFWLDLWGGRVAVNPTVGVEFDIRRFTFSLAGVWYHAAFDAELSPVHYVSGNHRGGLGLLIGFKYRWELEPRRRRGAR